MANRGQLNKSMKMMLVWLLVFSSQLMFDSAAMDSSSDDPADWLEMMTDARKSQTYQGTFVLSRGDEMSSMRVLHRFVDGEEQERLIALDGTPREIIRQGDRVICIFPGDQQVQLEQALPTGPFAAGIKDIAPLQAVYSIKVAGSERLADYEVVKVALMAKDQHRYSYLLWLEKNSGLLLKSVLMGQGGEVLERFQFTSLEIGGHISDEQIIGKADGVALSHQAGSGAQKNESLSHHWRLGWLPDGFSPAQYVMKRNSVMPENSKTRVFSDGLAMFSVFVERYQDVGMPEGASQMGATIAYARYVDYDDTRYVVTIVGEVPPMTAAKIAAELRLFSPT